jgi:transketolase
MIRTLELKALRRRTVEIDYTHQHRHAGGSLSALPIIAGIFAEMDLARDVFILSKGHAAPAYYAVLEWAGYSPNVKHPHPYRDPANGIPVTTGSLGHGLPLAVGFALAKKLRNEPGTVHVLLGDGEFLEGTTWESMNLAKALGLGERLQVHVDRNGWQGSCQTICHCDGLGCHRYYTTRGDGVPILRDHPEWHTHTITAEEYAQIMEELK